MNTTTDQIEQMFADARELNRAWRRALARLNATDTADYDDYDEALSDERNAYDELVDFIEANDMNGDRQLDPRNASGV